MYCSLMNSFLADKLQQCYGIQHVDVNLNLLTDYRKTKHSEDTE